MHRAPQGRYRAGLQAQHQHLLFDNTDVAGRQINFYIDAINMFSVGTNICRGGR
jgi:hypothetical protein